MCSRSQLLGRFTKDEFHFDSKLTISIGIEFQTRPLSLNRKQVHQGSNLGHRWPRKVLDTVPDQIHRHSKQNPADLIVMLISRNFGRKITREESLFLFMSSSEGVRLWLIATTTGGCSSHRYLLYRYVFVV